MSFQLFPEDYLFPDVDENIATVQNCNDITILSFLLCLEDISTIAQIKSPLLESARLSICLSPKNIIINTFIKMNVLMMMFC